MPRRLAVLTLRIPLGAALVLLLLAVAPSAQLELVSNGAGGCEPSWLPALGQVPGVSDGGVTPGISALAVFDDGTGRALYAGGGFAEAGGVSAGFLARWDGSTWSALEGGGANSEVYALTVFDDGGGPALYAAGAFSAVGGTPASHVAKWDGEHWHPLGSGVNLAAYALAVFDDGRGAALYVGGNFKFAGGQPANRVARWDGAAWSGLGSGVSARVQALAVFEDATGPALYVGGVFAFADGHIPANRIAKWDGTAWSSLGHGTDGSVRALATYDDGAGPALYAGGDLTFAGGAPASRIARWDGAGWSALDEGLDGPCAGLFVFDDGAGAALYAGGEFGSAGQVDASGLARWDGASWSPLGTGADGLVRAFADFDDGEGSALVAGGVFSRAGDAGVNHIASWKDASWTALGAGANDTVGAFAIFDHGGGPAMYMGGSFTAVDGIVARCIAKWDGEEWSPLGLGMSGGSSIAVADLAVFDDGSGPALYAGGGFPFADGQLVSNVAKWDGSAWTALGSGVNQVVYALEVFDDGTGPALYAGGIFFAAGGTPASRIAKWDGVSWSPVGGGMTTNNGPLQVHDLLVFDDGTGSALYAGGYIQKAGGVTVNGIAKWDGASWSALGSGVSAGGIASVNTLAVFDDGGGAALYAGGQFTSAGGVPANRVAKWNGTSWSALGSGVSAGTNPQSVQALAIFDDGRGEALYAGGTFGIAGGIPAHRIAKWDGAAWSALGGGLPDGTVIALAVLDSGGGPALHVGGGFGTSSTLDSHLAIWGGCTAAESPWTDLGHALSGAAGAPQLTGAGTLTPGSAGALDLSQAAASAFALLFVSTSSRPAPFACGTLVPVPAVLPLFLTTNPGGSASLHWNEWPASVSGLSLYFQYAIQDAAAVCGVALSNALRADVP